MGKVKTIQKTGKVWKFTQMIGVLSVMACVGYAMSEHNTRATTVALLFGIPSAAVWAFGRVGAWWFHE